MPTSNRIATICIWLIAAGSALILAACLSAWFPNLAWLSAAALMLGCACWIAGASGLGAARTQLPRSTVTAVIMFLLADVLLGLGIPLLLPPQRAIGSMVFGLPLGAALEIYGVGILPALILPLVFARSYPRVR